MNLNEVLLFDPEKFIFHYNNYKEDQLEIEKEWNQLGINEFMKTPVRNKEIDKQLKQSLLHTHRYVIRKGVPLKYMKQFILHLFERLDTKQNDKEYEIYLNTAFEGRIPDDFKNVPLFSEQNDLEEILRFHFLTNKGLLALKRVLWTLKETMTIIEYNPMLIQIISVLLIFISESDTYCVVKKMIKMSEEMIADSLEKAQYLRWYFTLNS